MKIYRVKNSLDETGIMYTAKDIKMQLISTKKSQEALLDYFEQLIARKVSDGSWSKATRRLYLSSHQYLAAFLSKASAPNSVSSIIFFISEIHEYNLRAFFVGIVC